MRTQSMRAVVLAFAAVLPVLVTFAPSAVVAQANGGPPIFLALPDVYPDVEGRAMLLREPGREIVVLSSNATPEDLGVALRLLARFRREKGAPARGEGNMIPIIGLVTPDLQGEQRARLQATLDELKRRPVANVGALGRGRWMRYQTR